jgi:hypothetical protein
MNERGIRALAGLLTARVGLTPASSMKLEVRNLGQVVTRVDE